MRGLAARLRSLWAGLGRPERLEAEMDEEMRFHLEMEAERLQRERGLEPEEARRQAAVAFGGVEKYKEVGRAARGVAQLTGMSLDLKLGMRMLRKHPGLSLIGTLALAVAIGSGATYLEFVNDLVRPSLRLAEGERVVGITVQDVASGQTGPASLHDYERWRGELRGVEGLGAHRELSRNLTTDDGRTEPVPGVEISASAFRLAPEPPLLGRPLLAEDEAPGAAPVVVLGEELWRARFAGDAGVVGRTVRLGGEPHTVVGVMPASFTFPVAQGVWVPLRLRAADYAVGSAPPVTVFGRLAPGVGLEAARAEVAELGRRMAAENPATHRHLRPHLDPYVASIWRTIPDGPLQIRIFYGMNLFFLALLAVCGVNVATLVFARTATREGEITVRSALGASRGRILLQLFAEALVLASLAAAVGLAAAAYGSRWAMRTFVEAGGDQPPFWWDARLAPETLLYAALLALLAAAIVGVVPGWKATGVQLQARLRRAAAGGGAGGGGLRFGGVWTGVIMGQVALTVLFLLVLVSVVRGVRAGDFGLGEMTFPAERYLSAQLQMDDLASPGATQEAAHAAFEARYGARYAELERRLLAEPGVAEVAYASHLPGMGLPAARLEVEGVPPTADADGAHHARMVAAGAGYLETLQAPILAGRSLTDADVQGGRRVVVVDEAFARAVLGGQDPMGRRIREVGPEGEAPGEWHEVVGVVRAFIRTTENPEAVVYRPAPPAAAYPLHLAVRAAGDPEALAPRVRAVAAEVDPALRLYNLIPLTETTRGARLFVGFLLRAIGIVGAVALLLSTAGIYALMSFTVARRTREIGVRSAVGAAPRRLLASIFSPALAQVALGVLVGSIPGALVMRAGLVEASSGAGAASGAAAVAGVALFMMTVAGLACLVPARRALRIQPTEALRADG